METSRLAANAAGSSNVIGRDATKQEFDICGICVNLWLNPVQPPRIRAHLCAEVGMRDRDQLLDALP